MRLWKGGVDNESTRSSQNVVPRETHGRKGACACAEGTRCRPHTDAKADASSRQSAAQSSICFSADQCAQTGVGSSADEANRADKDGTQSAFIFRISQGQGGGATGDHRIPANEGEAGTDHTCPPAMNTTTSAKAAGLRPVREANVNHSHLVLSLPYTPRRPFCTIYTVWQCN